MKTKLVSTTFLALLAVACARHQTDSGDNVRDGDDATRDGTQGSTEPAYPPTTDPATPSPSETVPPVQPPDSSSPPEGTPPRSP